MNYSTLIAIDPGASGAAVIRTSDGDIRYVLKYEGHDTILTAITKATMSPAGARGVAALIERVWASPVMGKSAAFAFGGNYEGWIVGLKVAGIPVFGLTPQEWQKEVAPGVSGQGAARKAALKLKAQELFKHRAEIRVTLTNCDALLLSVAAFARNHDGQLLGLPL